MIRPGERAPEFTARREDGSLVSLVEMRGKPVVLYFYPKAGTPGCSAETRAFARLAPEFRAHGVAVLGVSRDPPARQQRFATACGADFPLLSDPGLEIARSYGVAGWLGTPRRVTFLIDGDGRVIDVVRGMRPALHFRRAMERFLPFQPP